MTNAVQSRPRRARSAHGANPPQIAADLAQAASACLEATRILDCCADLNAPVVLAAAVPALRTFLDRPTGDVLIPVLVDLVWDHVGAHHALTTVPRPRSAGPAAPVRPGRWSTLTQQDVTAALREAFWRARPTGDLEATICTAVAAGLDGELLCWEIITRESNKHIGLIRKEANKLVRAFPDSDPDDLVGYGWKGLRVALRNYDPALGFAFSTFACPKINGAIRDGVRAEHVLPKRLTTFVRRANAAEEHLTQELSRTPSYSEIATYLDEGLEQMALLSRLSPAASLEELSNPWGDKAREPDCLLDAADPETESLLTLRNEALHRAVASLPDTERQAVEMLFLQEIPIGEAAAMLGVDTRWLRNQKRRGLAALKPVLEDWYAEQTHDATLPLPA